MNYFCHALNHLDRPYFMAGTAVPDWLSVADRRVRFRPQHLAPFVDSEETVLSEVAAGTLQHLQDDDWFHATRGFFEVTTEIAALFRKGLGQEGDFHYGFPGHVGMEMLGAAANIKLTHVPYKGLGLAQNDLLGGHIELMFPSSSQILPQLQSKRVRAIALGGPVRAPTLPEVPTFAEQGYPQIDTPGWQAMWAPTGTPRERLLRLQTEITRIVKATDIRQRIEEAGLRPIGSSSDAGMSSLGSGRPSA